MPRIVLLFSTFFICQGVLASGDFPYHHLAIFAGPGVEEKKDHDENTYAIGLEYAYRFSEVFSIGAIYETLGKDTIRNQAVVIPLSIHPGGAWRLFAGPGYEWHDKKEKYLARVGAGYSFELGGHWSMAPEAYVDFIENGDRTWVVGVAIGYHF